MRPIKLEMTAFGAYVDHVEINFERDLREEKIFLIHGATGAGKTTILDAISYALYRETSGKAREIKDMRSKGVPDSVTTEVEFTFALGTKIYRVKREIYYNSKRKDKYQMKAQLFRDEIPIESKENAVTKKIKEILGFDAEQFWQVVLLPQGKFKKFLFSDSDDRQKVLNILFDSEIYKKVEEALYERAKSAEYELKELENQIKRLEKELDGADSSSLDEIEEKLTSARKNVDYLKEISYKANSELADGKVLASQFEDLRRFTLELESAQIKLTETEKIFDDAQSEYKKRYSEESKRKNFEEKIRTLKEIQSALKDLRDKHIKLKREQEKLCKAEKSCQDCEDKAKRYEKRMNQLENDKIRLECEKIYGEVLILEAELFAAQKKVSIAKENLDDAQIEFTRLQIVNNAARLAMTLENGEPCPVCGSIEHPSIIKAAIPSVIELQNAEKKVARLEKEKSNLEKAAANIEGQLLIKKNQLNDNPELESAKKSFVSLEKTIIELEDCLERLKKGADYVEQNKKALDAANETKKIAKSSVDTLSGIISVIKEKIPEEYLTDSAKLDYDLREAKRIFVELDTAWKLADKNYRESEKNKSNVEGTLKTLKKNLETLKKKLTGKNPPDINILEQNATELRENYNASLDEKVKLENTRDSLKKYSAELEKVKSELAEKQKIADMWRRLSDVANATGKGESELKISFQRYFLSTMFNEVVTEANNRLKKMSNGRYLFQMKDAGKTKSKTAGLNLEIFDEQTGSLRPVETLSGGESFLASLSLALGLASVVRNKVGGIKLETIFIDEGFGSLDSETLDFAISTIIEQSGGRLVGIISHVEELKNQIPVRLEVFKTKTGSFAKFIC